MELLQLTYFCDAALTENFSKTAEKYPTDRRAGPGTPILYGRLCNNVFEKIISDRKTDDPGRTFAGKCGVL